MIEFHNVRFPYGLAFGTFGGPEFKTEVTILANGHEYRNTPYAHPRRRFEINAGIKTSQQISELNEFFISRKGRLHSFRFKDPFDCLSCDLNKSPSALDQIIGYGDGVERSFQLIKTYDDQNSPRLIKKPQEGSVLIAIDGAEVGQPEFFVDLMAGVVTFTTAPALGAEITAGYIFDIVVRFDTDSLDMTLEDYGAGVLQSIPLVEVLHA